MRTWDDARVAQEEDVGGVLEDEEAQGAVLEVVQHAALRLRRLRSTGLGEERLLVCGTASLVSHGAGGEALRGRVGDGGGVGAGIGSLTAQVRP